MEPYSSSFSLLSISSGVPVKRTCPPLRPPSGPYIDQIVSTFDNIEVMFDNDDRVAFIHQLVQYPQQDPDILEVQTGGRFIQYIKRLSRIPLRQLGSQLDTLALATG